MILNCCFFFFFNDTAPTEIYTLSLHDALPIFAVLGLDLRADDRATLPDDVLTNNADGRRPIPRQSALNDLEVSVLDDTRKQLAELVTLFPCAPVPLGTQ